MTGGAAHAGARFLWRPARRQDADELAPRLLPQQVQEVSAITGMGARQALRESIEASGGQAWALLGEGGTVEGLFGRVAGGYGLPDEALMVWGLGSEGLYADLRAFSAEARRIVEFLRAEAGVAYNFVDPRYGGAIRWLYRLGFREAWRGKSPVTDYDIVLMLWTREAF